METTPWEVNKKKISDAYIAGFLDGDGSITVGIERQPHRRRFPHRLRLKINFTQHVRHTQMLSLLKEALGTVGSVREIPTHHLAELVIQKREDIKRTLKRLLPYLILKRQQAVIMLTMITIFEKSIVNVRSSLSDKDFRRLFGLARALRKLNAGAGGKRDYELINPVTTHLREV